jgi:hypothetical protein
MDLEALKAQKQAKQARDAKNYPTSRGNSEQGWGSWAADKAAGVAGATAAFGSGGARGVSFDAYPKQVDNLIGSIADRDKDNWTYMDKDLQKEHPIAYGAGNVAGSILPYLAAAFSRNPTLQKMTGAGIESALGRLGAGFGIGAADATVRNAMNEKPFSIGDTALGGAAGAGGQFLADFAISPAVRALTKSHTPMEAAKTLNKHLTNVEGAPMDPLELITGRQALGPEASIAESSDGMSRIAGNLSANPDWATPNLTQAYGKYGPELQEDIIRGTQLKMQQATGVRNPVHPIESKEAMKAKHEDLSKQIGAIFDNITPQNDPRFSVKAIEGYLDNPDKGILMGKSTVSDFGKNMRGSLDRYQRESAKALEAKFGNDVETTMASGYIHPKAMYSMRKDAADAVGNALGAEQADLELAERALDMKAAISAELDKLPGFTELNDQYADAASINRYHKAAHDLITAPASDPERSYRVAQKLMATGNAAEQQAAREGVASAVQDMFRKEGTTLKTAKDLIKSKEFGDKLTAFFGEEAALNMQQAADAGITRLSRAKKAGKQADANWKPEFEGMIERVVNAYIMVSPLARASSALRPYAGSNVAAGGAASRAAHRKGIEAVPKQQAQMLDYMLPARGEAADEGILKLHELANAPRSNSILGYGMGPGTGRPLDKGLLGMLYQDVGVAPATGTASSLMGQLTGRDDN